MPRLKIWLLVLSVLATCSAEGSGDDYPTIENLDGVVVQKGQKSPDAGVWLPPYQYEYMTKDLEKCWVDQDVLKECRKDLTVALLKPIPWYQSREFGVVLGIVFGYALFK